MRELLLMIDNLVKQRNEEVMIHFILLSSSYCQVLVLTITIMEDNI